jgi:DNA-binding transcriptional ArsR family regulator
MAVLVFNIIVKYEEAVTDDHLSNCFAALADPTRRAIVARLSKGETTVNELAKPFAMSLPAISRHLKVLERSGLISRSRTAQQRPAKFEPQAIKAVADWVDQYRAFWDGSFDRLDAYLKDLGANDAGN